MAKIGILGGTFDPIHLGHLQLAEQALEEYRLDWVWFMPSGQPPHKTDHLVTPGAYRQAMVRLAIEVNPRFVYSDFELKRPGNTYSAQTFALLAKEYPCHEFYFIVGADSLYQIEKWYHPQEVMARTILLAAQREAKGDHRSFYQQIRYLEQTYGARILALHCPEMDVSSAGLRQMAAEGADIAPYLPARVAAYIREHRLYAPGRPVSISKGGCN